MRVDTQAHFLTLNDSALSESGRALRITDSIGKAVQGWTPGTRVSPIWSVKGLVRTPPPSPLFESKHELVFIGPVQPGLLLSTFREFSEGLFEVWVSAGSLNCILRAEASRSATRSVDAIKAWARETGYIFEHWQVHDGNVSSRTDKSALKLLPAADLEALSQAADMEVPPALRLVLQEYAALMASALTRSSYVSPADFSNIQQVARVTNRLVASLNERLSVLDLQTRLVTLNAALSRFTSQAFSGVPPVLETECHFWVHSLLGTGTANLALMRLTSWIRSVLGEARLREQLAALEARTSNTPTLSMLTSDNTLLDETIIQARYIGDDEVTPLITYFSGRDGFSSHLQTLSAPLSTLSECNSWRSSLLTVTHEISHIFVQASLGEVFPDPRDDSQVSMARKFLTPGYRAINWLEAARQFILEGVVSIDQAERPGEDYSLDDLMERIPDLLVDWRRETQEIMVHAFDFFYFYAQDTEFYIKSIWSSWCAVPGIEDRVPEYLLRTLSAISAPHLRIGRTTSFEAAKREVREALSKLVSAGGLLTKYAEAALNLLDKADCDPVVNNVMREKYGARLYLVRFVAIFLYSDRIAARLFRDASVRSAKGHDLNTLSLDAVDIGNPLTFLKDHLTDNPSEAESLWVLMALAYGGNEGRRHAP